MMMTRAIGGGWYSLVLLLLGLQGLLLVRGVEFAKIVTLNALLTNLEVTTINWFSASEVLVVGNNLSGGTTTGYVFRSTNGGASFTQVFSLVDSVTANHLIGFYAKTLGANTYYVTAATGNKVYIARESNPASYSTITINGGSATAAIYGVSIGFLCLDCWCREQSAQELNPFL